MTASQELTASQERILAELAESLRAVLRDFAPDEPITMETTFRDDLGMESIDVVSFAGRLQSQYGDTVNFAQFAASLDLGSVASLRVGQLVAHIASSLDRASA